MKKLSKTVMMGMLLFVNTFAHAQQSVEMADTMRADGKIYVVVAIILTVLAGFISYLFILDRKLGKIEKQIGLKSEKTL